MRALPHVPPPCASQAMRADMCEALMAVASERPSKALHAQELEMSLYEAAPTKVGYGLICNMRGKRINDGPWEGKPCA